MMSETQGLQAARKGHILQALVEAKGEFFHTKAGCVASQVRLFGTEVPENINYAQKRKNSRGVLGLLNTAELCAGNTERKH